MSLISLYEVSIINSKSPVERFVISSQVEGDNDDHRAKNNYPQSVEWWHFASNTMLVSYFLPFTFSHSPDGSKLMAVIW